MGALEPGGGVGGAVEALGPLQRMWRSVYQKAAAVAEARTQELLKYHVYVYPHGAGDGGGGGGGWVLLDEIGPLAANTLSPLAFTAIPQDATHLWLHFEGRGTGSGLGTLGVQLNGDNGATSYAWSMHYVAPSATHTQNDTSGDSAVRVVQQLVNGSEPAGALTTADVFVPHYAKSDARYQRIAATAQSDNLDGSGNDFPEMNETVGAWKSGAAVTAVQLWAFTSSTNFAAGTHVQLYGLRGGGAAPAAAGGLVEIGRAVATAGQGDLRVPATGALPTGYSGLTLAATGLNNHATVTQNLDVVLFFNDEVDAGKYTYTYTGATLAGTAVAGGSAADGVLQVGFAPAFNPAGPRAVFSLTGAIPLHEGTALPKAGQFLSGGLRGTAGELAQTRTTMGVYAPSPPAAITSVTLRCLSPGWRAGSTLVVYGHPAPA